MTDPLKSPLSTGRRSQPCPLSDRQMRLAATQFNGGSKPIYIYRCEEHGPYHVHPDSRGLMARSSLAVRIFGSALPPQRLSSCARVLALAIRDQLGQQHRVGRLRDVM